MATLVSASAVVMATQAISAVAPTPPAPSGDSVGSTARPSEPALSQYVVEPGDTLWSIAVRIAPGEDPRPIVQRLAERSGGTALRPGQRLSLAGIR
jgi:Tfp pilus assembly protein FimV